MRSPCVPAACSESTGSLLGGRYPARALAGLRRHVRRRGDRLSSAHEPPANDVLRARSLCRSPVTGGRSPMAAACRRHRSRSPHRCAGRSPRLRRCRLFRRAAIWRCRRTFRAVGQANGSRSGSLAKPSAPSSSPRPRYGSWSAPCAPPEADRAPPALFRRTPRPSRAARSRAACRRRLEAPGSSVSSCLSAVSRSPTAASILSNFSPVLNDPLLALARIFVPSTAISESVISLSPINAVTLCVSAGQELPPARPGSRRARDSSAAAACQPAIAAAFGEALHSRADPTPSIVA